MKLVKYVSYASIFLCMANSTFAVGQSDAHIKTKADEIIVNAEKLIITTLGDKNSTGSRLGITALETPATLQSVSGDVLRLRGDGDVVSAVTRMAGITSAAVVGSGGFGFAARGFSSSSVTMLYDGTKSLINTGSLTYPYDTWNVERIDALNGPASVLYGSGAIGAAINVIPRKPSAVRENTVRLLGGSLNTWGAALDSTGTITDDVLYRFDISRNSSDGYVQRGDSDSTAVTAAVAYEVADSLKFTLSGDYADRQQTIYNGMPLINGEVDKSLRKVNYSPADSDVPFKDRRLQLLTEWEPATDIAVRNITSYIRGERLWHYASRFNYQPATDDIVVSGLGTWLQHQDQIGNYTDLTWKHALFGLDNTWAAGIEIVRLSNDRYNDNYTGTRVTDLLNTDPELFPASTFTTNYQETRVDQYSLFAEDRLALTDALSVVGGIRFDHSAVERENLVDHTVAKKNYTPVSWRLGSVYALTPDFSLYAQYATAVDPVANLCCVTAAQMAFAMSEGRQTEIGLKQIAWDGKLEWSLAAYRITKNKLLTPDPVNAGLSIQVGQQSSRGLEATMVLMPARDWRLEVSGTVLKSEYDDFSETVGGVPTSRDGNRVINVPQRSANVWLTWAFLPQWSAQTGLRYVGDSYVNADNTQRLPAYNVVDAGLHWDATQALAFDLRGKNIFDKFYAYTSVANGNNGGQWVLGAPRTVEVVMTAKF